MDVRFELRHSVFYKQGSLSRLAICIIFFTLAANCLICLLWEKGVMDGSIILQVYVWRRLGKPEVSLATSSHLRRRPVGLCPLSLSCGH